MAESQNIDRESKNTNQKLIYSKKNSDINIKDYDIVNEALKLGYVIVLEQEHEKQN